MAMNRARRTSNLNNILTYDTLGNSTLIANLTVEGLTGAGFVKADAAGLLSVDTAAYTVVTGATNYLTKITAPNTLGQSLVYDSGTSVLVNTATLISGYGHAFQVLANAAGGIVVSTTDVASGLGIVNSSSGNKTWDLSPYGNHLVLNESGISTRIKFDAGGNITIGDIVNSGHKLEVVGSFRTTGTNTLSQLQGVGNRMVVADTNGVLSTQAIPVGSVTSVNGLTGAVTLTTSNIAEGTNLYYTDARARAAISLTTTGSSGAATYSAGVLNVPNYTLAGLGGVGGTIATGQVAYATAANTIGGSNNLFWDAANSRLGIGTNAPASRLHVTGSIGSYVSPLYVENTGSASVDFKNVATFVGARGNATNIDDNTNIGIWQKSNIVGNYGIVNFFNSAGNLTAFLGAEYLVHTSNQTGNLIFGTVSSGTVAVKAKIYNTGNLVLQNGGTFTDGGQRLQVYGDTLLRGSGNSSATTALTVQNSDGSNMWRVLNNGQIQLGSSASFPYIRTISTTISQDLTGTKVLFGTQDASIGNGAFTFGSNTLTHTTGTVTFVQLLRDFTTTSGTGATTHLLLNGTINQTGGANGITRGLYVNPILTSAADWRSIEWSNNTGWGLYGAGTANNYLAGNLSVGTLTTIAGFNIVSGNGIFAGSNIQFQTAIRDNRSNSIISQSADTVASNRTLTIGNATYSSINFSTTGAGSVSVPNIYIGTQSSVVNNIIVAGSTTSTNGSVILRGSYTNGYLTTIGTDASSGGPMISYGVESAQNSTAGAFVSSSGIAIPRSAYVQTGGHIWYTAASSTTAIGTAITMTKHMELYNSGNLVLGGGADDAVNRLQVGGDARFNGSVVIGNASLKQIFPTTDGTTVNTGAQTISIVGGTGGYPSIFLGRASAVTNTFAGTQELVRIIGNFTPTSGSHNFEQLRLQSTINQTGGANGVTRGLYINPTLTSAADWRSIEWSNNTGWGLYGVGTAKNYLNGTTLIGTATDDGINKLQVAGSIKSTGIMRSDASRTAAINDVSIALLGSNITTYAAGFTMAGLGYGLNAIYAQHEQRFGGNASFDEANLNGGGLVINKLAPTAAGTVTMGQAAGRIRTMSNLHLMTQFDGNNNLTVTHMSGLHIYGHYRTSGTGVLTVSTAYYGIFLADPNEFSTGATVTGGNYGFYQQGTAPYNYFGGKVSIGTTATDGTSKLRISGLPTSNAGLLTGEVWNNGGVLTIV